MKFYSAILILLLFPAEQAAGQCTLRYSGKVTDADTKELLEGATIELKDIKQKVKSDKSGAFVIEGLCPGHYDVQITHVGCQPFTGHIHIKDDFSQEYTLSHAAGELSGVTVVGQSSASYAKEELKGKALDAVKGLSLGESLKNITGVSVLQTGNNIYKPVIHGLHSNRVLILNNGIRQEGQQWGNEHAPEVDPYIANRISVIKGAATMRYGGDAIGGVVLVEPKLLRAVPGTGGEINVAGFSNNRAAAASAIIEGNLSKAPAFSWRLQGTYKRGGNARTPNYWLANSGMQEINFSATAGWRKSRWGTELFYSQFNTKLAIFSGSHIGNTTDLMNAINSSAPPDYIRNVGFSYKIDRPYQDVQHHLLKSKTFFNTGTIGRLNLIGSFQYNNRKEYDVKRFQSSEDVPQLDLSIATTALDVVWDHFTWKKLRGTFGVTGMFQDNQYSRRLFIPNYQSVNTGLFIIEKWEEKKWVVEAGLRYDYRNFFNTNSNAGRQYPDRNYSSLSGNFGATYRIKNGISVYTNLSSAWRAPNVNELYSDGLHHGAARIEKGDSSLAPERANSLATGMSIEKGRWNIEAGIYSKLIDGFIYLQPTFPPQLTIRGAFPSFRFTQTNARLNGADISISYEVTHHLRWTGKASLLRAWNRTASGWLIQMPADRYENEIAYSFNNGKRFKESYLKVNTQNILYQKRVPVTGNIEITRPDGSKYLASDYAPPPPAYMLLGMEAGTELKLGHQTLTVILAASNIFNTVYRDYMNAFRYYADEMGANYSLRLKLPFEFVIKKQHQ
jgi:iron complex outermembrane receptor protein